MCHPNLSFLTLGLQALSLRWFGDLRPRVCCPSAVLRRLPPRLAIRREAALALTADLATESRTCSPRRRGSPRGVQSITPKSWQPRPQLASKVPIPLTGHSWLQPPSWAPGPLCPAAQTPPPRPAPQGPTRTRGRRRPAPPKTPFSKPLGSGAGCGVTPASPLRPQPCPSGPQTHSSAAWPPAASRGNQSHNARPARHAPTSDHPRGGSSPSLSTPPPPFAPPDFPRRPPALQTPLRPASLPVGAP